MYDHHARRPRDRDRTHPRTDGVVAVLAAVVVLALALPLIALLAGAAVRVFRLVAGA